MWPQRHVERGASRDVQRVRVELVGEAVVHAGVGRGGSRDRGDLREECFSRHPQTKPAYRTGECL